MRISVLTSCTGQKVSARSHAPLTYGDFARGPEYVAAGQAERTGDLVAAESLYRGQQHLRLMRGVDAARAAGHEVSVGIVSAGYGLLDGDALVVPYECTFEGMPSGERRAWAARLGLPEAVRARLAEPSDLTLVLLGAAYLDACALGSDLELGGPAVALCGAGAALRLGPVPRLRTLVLGKEHTRRFACGLVGLKGEVGGRLLAAVAADPESFADSLDDHDELLNRLDALGGWQPAAISLF